MRNIFLVFLLVTVPFVSFCQVIEAEKGMLSGTQVSTQRPGYTGTGYVTGFDADGDKITLTASVNKGVYNLYVRYASPSGDKFNFVYVNDENVGSVAFPSSSSFVETKVGKLFLQQGTNTIAIVKEWGYFDVDNIRLEASQASEIHNIAANLVTPVPSSKADSLYDLLSHTYGKVILSGQYGGSTELDRIKNLSGRTPVMRGFDLMDYSPSRVERGTTSVETENAIAWSKQRGIVTFAWHWNAPKDLIDQPGKEWWRGFYTEATTFDVTKAMNDPASAEFTLILRDIDVIAAQLKKLKDANVPVLWRPLHEAEGGWFWWGAKGAEPCRWLWKLLFERLVNHHQLNNLIWVWTSTGTPGALNWYPGDNYVDVIGADIYLPAGAYSSSFITFDNMAALYEGRKIIALSENGPIPDPESLFTEGAAWSWFSTWGGSFIMDGISNTTSHINKVFNHEYVITLDEIDAIDQIIASLDEKKQKEPETVTGLDEEDVAPFIAFQNPIHDRLAVKINDRIAKVMIYNMQGQLQFERTADQENSNMEFDFQHKPAGMYLLKVVKSENVEVYRMVKVP